MSQVIKNGPAPVAGEVAVPVPIADSAEVMRKSGTSVTVRKVHAKNGGSDHFNFSFDFRQNSIGALPAPNAPAAVATDGVSEVVSEEEFDLDEDGEHQDQNCDIAPVPVHQRADFKWLVLFGCILTLISGFLNVVGILSAQQTTTHVSGTTSNAARWLVDGEGAKFGNLMLMLGSFMLGAATSGAAVGSNKFVLGHRYGAVMTVVGVIYMAGAFLLWSEEEDAAGKVEIGTQRMAGLSFWAFGSGMQNALCTSFSGAVIRTTHTTGMLTDIGMVIGHVIRNVFTQDGAGDVWKLGVLVPQYLSFFVGGVLAAWGHDDLGINMAFFPAGAMMLFGIVYNVLVAAGKFEDFLVEEKIEEEIAEVERKVVKALHSIYHQPSHISAVRDARSQNLDAPAAAIMPRTSNLRLRMGATTEPI